jgi:hypothetical protein
MDDFSEVPNFLLKEFTAPAAKAERAKREKGGVFG